MAELRAVPLLGGLSHEATELLFSRFGYILFYVAWIYPAFVFLDRHEIPWDKPAALVIRLTVSVALFGLAMACRTRRGRPYALWIITVGFLIAQGGFTLLAWHAKGLGLSDGDDFESFFGIFCVLIPASVWWTASVGIAMIALEVANYALSGTKIDAATIGWQVVPYFIIFLTGRHAANVLETALTRRTLERTQLETTLVELQKTQDILVQAEKMSALGRLTAGVAHELNNPLFVIAANLKVLDRLLIDVEHKSPSPAGDSPQRQTLQRLDAALTRASFITQLLREFSAPPKRRDEPVNLNEVVTLSISLVMMTTKEKSVNVHTELGEVPFIRGDSQSLVQVFVNLIENACDAVSAGGNVWVKTSTYAATGVRLEVRDDGPGIPPEDLQKLIEPFFTTKEPDKGIGLGLAVANSVIERHGGHLQFANANPGAVATISFRGEA